MSFKKKERCREQKDIIPRAALPALRLADCPGDGDGDGK